MTTKKQITFSEARPLLGSIYLSRVLPVLFSGIIQFMKDDLTKMNVLSRLLVYRIVEVGGGKAVVGWRRHRNRGGSCTVLWLCMQYN